MYDGEERERIGSGQGEWRFEGEGNEKSEEWMCGHELFMRNDGGVSGM